jgi:7-cyano-7-deazaguanine synthase in queuosine biosynthesis
MLVNFRFQTSDRDRSGRRNLFPERSRRTRPMFFLSMAGAVALELGIPRIHINENGVLAINLPFEYHLHGFNASRHAHPETLRRFESLLRAIWPFDSQPAVINPFSQLTKAEEIKHLGRAKDLAEHTISCQYAGQQRARLISWLKKKGSRHKGVRECGLCMPCLIRRSAMESAGVFEPASHYFFDARRAFRKPSAYAKAPLFGVVKENVHALREFSNKILKMKKSEFALAYLSDLSLVPASSEEIAESTGAAFRLYKRFARECIAFIEG